MKKFITIAITAALALSMTLIMASCGSAPENTSSAPNSPSSGSSSSDAKRFATIKEYVENSEVQEQMETMAGLFKDSGLTFSVTGEDNKLIYTYTYPDNIDTSGMSETMDEIAEQMAPSFELVAETLKTQVEVENPVLVVKWLAADGKEIFSKEFTSSSDSQ